MGLLPLLLLAGVDWQPWSSDTLDRARRQDRLVFVAVTRGEIQPLLDDEALASTLADGFVAVRVDRDERPDLADIARLASILSSDASPPEPRAPVWALLTPALHPVVAGAFDALTPAGLAAHLAAAVNSYRHRRAEIEGLAGVAAARLAAAQTPEPPEGPLDRVVVERALKGAGETKGPLSPGSLRLLLAEFSRSPIAPNRDALTRGLVTFVEAPVPTDVADRALRLCILAEGFGATGWTPLREAASAAAVQLAEGPRDAEGVFIRGGDQPRAFAFENGLAIRALVASSSALGRAGDLEVASRAAAGTIAELGPWPTLVRCGGPAGRCGGAFLEDYAFLAEGLLDLHDATGVPRWRDEALHAVDAAIGRFVDASAGGWFDTDSSHAPLPARLRNGYDGDRPSANGVMAAVLLRLARATGEKRFADLSRDIVEAFRGDLQRAPGGMETMAAAAAPFTAVPAASTREAPHSVRETRGPVTLEVSLEPAHVRSDRRATARIHLAIAPPWVVNGHRPMAADLVPLTVSIPGDRFVVGSVTYPAAQACATEAQIVVPLRLRSDLPPGPTVVRLTVRFQLCQGAACQAPDSVILEVPFPVEAPVR
ncbi:MAG: DUF255 domain-containing protein [Vicinamibacteria bacterium]